MAKNPFGNNTTSKKKTSTGSDEIFSRMSKLASQRVYGSGGKASLTPSYQSRVETPTAPAVEQTYRDATFKDYTWNALKQGYYNSRLGEESYDAMLGKENEQQKYLDILASDDYQFEGGNAFEDAIAGAAQLLGQQARQWTNTRTLGAAATGAATGAGIGAVMGAGIASPVTAAGGAITGAKAGFMAGSVASNFEIEAGLAYNEMIEQGVSPETAKKVALGIGGANAALEAVQLDELAKSFKILKNNPATEAAADSLGKRLLDMGMNVTKSVGKETAQEVAQEGTTIHGVQQATKMDTGEKAYTSEEVIDRLFDTAKSSALSFGVMNVPHIATGTTNAVRADRVGSIYNGDINALVEEGLQSDQNSDSYKMASQLKSRLDNGGKVSNTEANDLAVANQRAINTENKLRIANTPAPTVESSVETAPVQSRASVIQSRLAKAGMETSVAESTAKTIDRILSGDTSISSKDKDVLSVNNAAARQVFEEETGVKLPASNSATRKAVSEYIAQTAIKQQETAKPVENVMTAWQNQKAQEEKVSQLKDTPVGFNTPSASANATLQKAAEVAAARTKAREAVMPQTTMATVGSKGQAVYKQHLPNAKNVTAYTRAFQRYYDAGQIGYPLNRMITEYGEGEDPGMLVEAYNAGVDDSNIAPKGTSTSKKKNAQKGEKTPSKGKGKFYDSRTSGGKSVDENTIKALKQFAKVFNIDIELRDSIDEGDQKSVANGKYENGKVILAADSDNPLIVVLKHEVTHHIQRVSPQKYKELKDYVMQAFYDNSEEALNLEIQRRIDLNARYGFRTLSRAKAMDEIVADATEKFLTDRDSIDALVRENRSLAETILNAIRDVLRKIEAAMKGVDLKGYSNFMNADQLKQAEKMWVEALTSVAMEDGVGIQYDGESESFAPVWSLKTWNESEYMAAREDAAKTMAKQLGISKDAALAYIDDVNSIAKLIADDRVRLDYDSNLDENATVLKPNQDYTWTLDMSTLCSKRLLFTGTFDAIQKALPNTVFDSEDIVRLRKMMQDKHLEVACGICYVESTRREIGRITQEFIDRYKEAQKTGKPISRVNSKGESVELKKTKDQMITTVDKSSDKFYADKDYTPNLGELNTTDIDLVKRDHPLVYEAYLNFMNARGQAKPKLLETRAEYKGEILKHFKSKNAVNARNAHGGLRLQSFSDFEVPHMIDMMQAVMDMSRVGLQSQAYTKVPAFAEVFGGTGVKINLSLIAKDSGLDADGNLIFDDVEGINHKEAFRLREQYSKNVGTILVGKNDAHIIAAMADPRIDFIIPFHKSSWKESLYDALGLTGYDNYESTQNEKPIDNGRKIANFDPSEYWDFSKTGDENAQIYLAKCREDGRTPKFPQFQGYPGYWKLLIDFKMYDNDGVGSPQTVVRPDFNMDAANRILTDYEGGHRSFPVAKDVVDAFVSEYKAQKNTTEDGGVQYSLKYDDAIDQLESGTLDKSKNSHLLVAENTPRIYIDKADAKDLKIIMAWDTAYLAMNKKGEISGNYHGLGADVMKAIPKALEDPLYIVKQDNDRIVAVTEIVVKGKRPTLASIELDTYKATTQDGEIESDNYNLIVTVFDAQPSYLQNTVFKGVVKYNKNNEDPAHFILRLKSLKKAVSDDDHAASSVEDTVPQSKDSVKQFSLKDSDANQMEADLDALRQERTDLEDQLDVAYLDDLPDAEIRKLNNRLTKVNAEIDKIVAEERKASVLTPMQDILDNLSNYRRSDLESLAEQISRGAWDDYEELSRSELEDALRETILDRELSPLEMQSKKFGLRVRPVAEVQYQLKTPDEMLDITKAIMAEEHKANAVTDAEIMSQAIKDLKLTGVERDTVKNYQDAMKKLADYEKELAVYEATKGEHSKGRTIYTDASGKVKKSGLKYSEKEKAEIQRKVEWWKRRLRDIEQKEEFKKVLKREKAKMAERHAKEISDLRSKYNERMDAIREKRDEKIEAEKQKLRDYKDRQRDTKEYKALKAKLESDVKWLNERLTHPTDAKHIPEEFKKGVAAFLNSLDFETKYTDSFEMRNGRPSQKVINLRALRETYENILKDQSSMMELDETQLEALKELERICEYKRVADLDYSELGLVRDAIQYIKMSVAVANNSFNENIKETISQMGEALIDEQRRKNARKDRAGIIGGADKLINFDNVSPADKFHEFGGVMEKLYGEIRKGFDKHINNVQSAIDYTQKLIKGNEDAIKEWSGKKAKTTKFQISDGTTIELTPAQVMSLYALVKREQAVGHVLGSGIVPSGVEIKETKKFGKVNLPATKKLYSERASRCTIEDIQKIVATLTPEQKKIADGVTRLFTSKCADWGNETAMKLYGYKKFLEPNYFPIKSSDAYLNARFDDSGDVLIKNLGFTKNTVVNANNPIVIEDIFDVLADHVNKMSMYNALVVPLTDFTRVFNYKSKNSDGTINDSVQKALETSGGTLGIQYIKQFMKDVNKQANSLAAESFINQSISRYKKAKIAASARVLLQQPTAITRAAAMVDPKYLIKGLQQKANYEEMFNNSEIAYWKSLGFYQTDMGRNMKDILLDNESKVDRLAMGMYGKADDFAWGHLWNAIKLEQADAHPGMDKTSSEFMELVANRFEEVVDRTQVVDSVFHRSQIMRSPGAATKVATAFMAEPTKAFNLLRTDLVDSINSKDYSKFKRSVVTYVANAVLVSVFAGIADMIRDDEDEDDEGNKRNLWDKYRDAVGSNIASNINPLGMIPYVKEINSMIQGYDVNRMEMASTAEFVKTARKWTQGKYSYPYLLKETIEDFSELLGIPLKNAVRDVTALVRTAGDLVGGHYYADYAVDKLKYDISNADNRSIFYKHYTDALMAGDEAAAEKILVDMVVNGIPYENIISKGYQVQKEAAFSEARKLIAAGKTEEAKSLIRKLAKQYDKSYTTLWKAVKSGDPANVPEDTYDFKDLQTAVKKGKDTELIEDYLTEYGGYSEESIEEAIKMLTEKYR